MDLADPKTSSSPASEGAAAAAPQADGLGLRLRAVRQGRNISVRELARRASVSASLVSQIELGHITPSVSTLWTLAQILEISIDGLFKDAPQGLNEAAGAAPAVRRQAGPVQRGAARQSIKLASGVVWERLTAMPDDAVEFLHVRYDVGSESCPEQAMLRHSGREYGYVLSGRLGIRIGFDEYELAEGDSFSFDAPTPHRIWAIGKVPATAIWVVLNRNGEGAELSGA
jgi:transcriptional regulator with XRE-family HTH domain